MRIFLVGFMGCGKSRVGTELARLMKFDFVDIDSRIERIAGHSVKKIFEGQGEAGFRAIETSALKETVAADNVVVATGGGTPVRAENFQLMQRHGSTVWLKVPFAIIDARLSPAARRTRPLFADADKTLDLFNQRVPIYRQAQMHIDLVGDEPPNKIARDIFERVCEP
jgi:shikimate kinase